MLETVIFVLLINNNRKNQVIGGCDIEQPLAHVSRLRFCSWAVLSGIYIWDSGQCNLGHSDSLNPVCVVAGWATPYYILLANLLLPYVNTAREGGAERPPAVIL